MQLHDIIRSCQEFPPVIPVLQVSPLRVTHPSAMVAMVQAPLPHRLACVKHSVSVHPEPGSNSSFNIFFSYIFLFTFFSSFDRDFSSLKTSSHLCFFLLFCFPLSSPTFAVDKNYITKFIPFCQYLFLSFFPFFILPLLLYPFITPYMHYISFPLLFPNTIYCFVS